MNHKKKGCNVLGEYCWTCKVSTEAGVPGWRKTSRSDINAFTKLHHRSPWGGCVYNSFDQAIGYYGFTEAIVWANGDTETPKDSYKCMICDNGACKHGAPVLRNADAYKEIVTKKSYWSWAEGNGKRDVKTDDVIERVTANPDTLVGE